MITFEDRKAKIKTVDDIGAQISLAKKYAATIRTKAKKASTLGEKLKLNEEHKQAVIVLRQLRVNYFDIEDELMAKQGVAA